MKSFNLTQILGVVLGIITPLIPFIGDNAHGVVERAVTLPKADMDKLCMGMSPEDEAQAIVLGGKMADAVSDFAVFVASRGKIAAD